jgi:LPS-assembly protein
MRRTRFLIILWMIAGYAPWSHGQVSSFFSPQQNFSAKTDDPVYLEADAADFDQNTGIITATGNVQIHQGSRLVLADSLRYDQKQGTVTATGHVLLRNPGQQDVYADFAQLQPDLRQGVIENLRLRLNDNSRLAARRVTRPDDQTKDMEYAVFSPCRLCAKNPDAAPLWQIKAKQVRHNEKAQDIIYHDATMELYGVPVFYTPYLSHPDPDVRHRSGLLPPQFRNSSELGFVYRQPFYYNFNPSQDLVIEPIIMTNDGFILNNSYRQRLDSGVLDLRFSGGTVEKRSRDNIKRTTERGHINAAWQQDIDENWRSIVQVNRASDKTYLRRYGFSGDDVLVSRASAEGFYGRSYANIRALSFQGLRDFDRGKTTPIILPQLSYNHVGEDALWGGEWQAQTDILNIIRQEGTDTSRATLDMQWSKPWHSEGGHIFDLTLRTIGVGYRVNDYDNPQTPALDEQQGWRGRVVPEMAAAWRYPLLAQASADGLQTYLEPMVTFVAAPNVGNNDRIPNEDSLAFEFDESNLFALKRFPGYDRIAGGQRLDYGINYGLFDANGRGGRLLIGQSYRWREDSTYAPGSGLDRDLSDIVGKVELSPSDNLDLLYRFRIDSDDPALRRSEFSAVTQTGPLKLGLDYIFLDRLAGNGELGDREELGARASWQMTENWNLAGRVIGDVNNNAGTREWTLGLTYGDECLSSGVAVEREFIADGENKPGTSFIFRIDLKDLGGELQQDYFTPKRAETYTGTLLPQFN